MPATVMHVKTLAVADGTATSVVRPSDWNSSHSVSLSLASNELVKSIIIGALTLTSGVLSFGTGGNVSFGLNGSTITASAPAGGGGGMGLNTALTNTSIGMTANSSGLSLSFPNFITTARASNDGIGTNTALTANGVSMTANSSGLSLNFPAFLTTAAASNHSHGNPQLNLTNLSGTTASNSAGFTLSLSAGNYLTTARASNDGLGTNTALTANGVSMTANSSGLSLNFPAFLTTAAASNHSHGNPTLALTNILGTTASNSAGFTLSLSVSPGGAGDGGNVLAAAGSTAASTGTVVFSNANNVSFGLNGSTMTASIPAFLTTARASTDALGLNTALTANGVSMTANSSGLSLNFPAFLTTAAASNHSHGNPTLNLTNLSGTTASNSAGFTLSLSAAAPGGGGGIAAAAGANSVTSGTMVFSNANGVSFGLNGQTLTASVAAGGGAAFTRSNFMPEICWGSSTHGAISHAQPFVIPCPILMPVSASRADIIVSLSISSSSNSSHAGAVSFYAGVYTRNGSTLSLASSGSQSYQWTNTSNNSLSSLTGYRRLSAPLNLNLTVGDYWIAVMSRTNTTNANWFTGSVAMNSMGNNAALNDFLGEASTATNQFVPGLGLYSTSSTALPSAIAFSELTGHGSSGSAVHMAPLVQLHNFTA